MTPASIGDWTMFTGLLASLVAFAAIGFRWVLAETETERRAATGAFRFPANRPPAPRNRIASTAGRSASQDLAQHHLQDAAVPEVIDLGRAVDARDRAKRRA